MHPVRSAKAPPSSRTDAELSAVLNSTVRLTAALNRSARQAREHVGLTGAQLFVVRLLAEAPAQSVNDLAARTGTHQSTVSVLVSRLVARGLVARSTDAADGRRVTLALTPAGRALTRKAPTPAYARLADALRRLPQRERRALAQSLARLLDELGEGGQAPGMLDEPPLQPRIARRDRRRR
jgi:DNA-binding MarR family transcriptional regulator